MGLMKKLTSVLVASSLVLGSVGMALAAPTEEQVNASAARLAAYDIVKGRLQADGTTDLALGEPITRAELLKVVIMGLGYTEAQVNVLKGAPSFSDVDVNQWYAPYVALAKNIAEQNGFEVGYPDGTFRPNNQVTAIEALVFVMKLLGITPVTGENWIQGNIDLAVQNGVITSADAEALLDAATEPANRGLAFTIVDTAFMTYTVDGKNVYQQFVDKEAPGLAVDATPESVQAATITITGTVTGASELYAGSDAITFDGEGKFSYEAALEVGQNTITLTAKDIVGNVTSVDVVVERTVGAAAAIDIEIAEQIVAGSEAEMKIVVTDATGAAVEIDEESLNVIIGGEIGTYADGVFKASEKAGKGTITVTYGELEPAVVEIEIVPGAPVKVEAEKTSVKPGAAVKLFVKDAFGNVIKGATFYEESPDAVIEGNTFIATKAGTYTVYATIGEVTVEGTVGVYGAVDSLAIEAASTIVANGKTEVELTIKAVDEEGNFVSDQAGWVEIDTIFTDKAGQPFGDLVEMKDGKATIKIVAATGLADQDVEVAAILYKDKDASGGVDKLAEGSATFSVVEQIPTAIKVEAPEYLPTADENDPVNVKVTVVDQLGVAVEGAWTFDVTISGHATLEAGKEVLKGEKSLESGEAFDLYPLFEGDSGTATVTVSFPGLTSGSASLKVAEPMKGYRLALKAVDKNSATVSDGTKFVEFEVSVLDRNGVPTKEDASGTAITTYAVTVKYTDAPDDALIVFQEYDGTGWNTVAHNKGSVTVTIGSEGTVKFRVASKKAAEFSLAVEDPSGDLKASNSATAAFVPGDPEYVAFATEDLYLLRSEGKTTLTAQLYDEFGNPTKKSGVSITFADTSANAYDGVTLNGKAADAKVTTDENGKASVEVVIEDYRDAATTPVTIEVSSSSLRPLPASYTTDVGTTIYGETALYAVPTIASKMSVQIIKIDSSTSKETYPSSVDAGDEVILEVTVKDNKNRPVTGVENDLKVEASSKNVDLTGVTFSPVPGKDGVYRSTDILMKKAEAVTFTVALKNLADPIEGSKGMLVRAGELKGITVAQATKVDFDPDDDPSTVVFEGTYDGETNKVIELTLKLTDAFGNEVAGSKNTSGVDVTFSGTSVEVRNANDLTVHPGGGKVTIDKGRNSVTIKVIYSSANTTLTITTATGSFELTLE